MRFVRTLGLVALLFGIAVTAAWASLPQGPGNAPGLIAPEPFATAYEGGLRFAWTPVAGTARQVLVVSTRPFDATGWTAPSPEVSAVETTKPTALLSETGLTLDRDMPLYWAVGTSRTAKGPFRFTATRTINVLRKFTNQVQPSPFLEASPIGKATPASPDEPIRIHLAAGYTIDPAAGEPALPEGLRSTGAPALGDRTWLMHYGDADPASVREAVLAAGGLVVAYIPDHTFLVRFAAPRTPQLNAVSWTGAYQPAYKLSTRLDPLPEVARRLTVLAFPDADVAALRTALEGAGARVVDVSNNGINKMFRVDAAGAAVRAIAQLADVAWVEPYVQPVLSNGNAEWIVQTFATNNRHLWDLGIAGQGEIIHHSDSGINMSHEMFNDGAVPILGFGDYPTHRKVVRYELGGPDPDIAFGDHGSFHGSHTAGTTAGNDLTVPLAGFDGIAKFAKIWHSDLSGAALGTGISPPVDLNDLYQPSYTGNAAGAARISTNSWGAPVGGAYDMNSFEVDQFMWNHPDYLLCFANGNSGGSFTVGSPATAKNCVSVGGVINGSIANAKLIYSSTSRGPTQDNRRKPTVCSPAQSVTSSTTGTASYSSFSGTSMASPNTAATAALLREYLREGWYPTGTKVPANGFSPSAALLKALLVNSGTNDFVAFPNAPDNNVGWGRICADSVLYFAGDTKRLLLVDQTEGLGHGEMIEYKVNVVNASSAFEVALCWTDFPGNPAGGVQLVNNLNLTVTDGISSYKGNRYTAGASATGGSYDAVNVEETVLLKIPTTGIWTIRVEGTNVPFGPQAFGLVVTGGVGVSAGAVALDRPSYNSSGPAEVRVTDTDAGGSVSVTMASTSEPAGETLVISGANGVYASSIPLSPFAGTVGDGTLHVSHGDIITATYNDASPAATIVASAVVSFQPPVITGVSASVGASTVVTWFTDKNATSKVYYGSTPALGSSTTLNPASVFSHSATLSGLTPGQTYYFDVESSDLMGNTTRDDRGGLHYTVTAPPAGDLLLVYGGDTFERPTYYTAALSELGWSYDVWSGAQSETPALGNLSSGMRSYKAIWWQPGLEHYPPVSADAQTAITQYLDGGGRLALTGHDICWALADFASPYATLESFNWVVNTLRTIYNSDPAGWTAVSGIAADPISDPYVGGLNYQEHRSGASGDEVDATGGAVSSWRSGDPSPDDAGIRWDSGGPLGTPGSGVWGGAPSRLATMYYEWTGVDPFVAPPSSPIRREIMRRTLKWLLGRDKPTATVVSPNGGEVLTTNSTNISWNESTDGGTNVASRTIEYSTDGGVSWVTITGAAGPSPYNWDLTTVPNGSQVVVRVTVFDDGSPNLKGFDVSNAAFAIQRVGGDLTGPVVVAGTIASGPNPITSASPATLTATVSDSTTGISNIAAAEWSTGAAPAPAGTGTAMSGTFTTPKVAVSAALPTINFLPGTRKLWVRGQDANGNWGNATALQLVVNSDGVVGVDERLPVSLELRQNAPNPVTEATTISFGLPVTAMTRLAIYDVSGRHVRELVNGSTPAGMHTVRWNRTDEKGRPVKSGVFYYRMVTDGKVLTRHMVVLN